MNIQENFPLKTFNTFGVEAKAKYFAEVHSLEELKETLQFSYSPILVLGGGSNVLFTKDFDGLVIKLNLNETDIARFSEVKFQFPGVNIETQMTRYYPHGELFAHVIGYVGRINDKELKSIDKDLYAGTNLIGKIGVEKHYENLLHGLPGNESVEADAHGNVLRHLGRKDPVRGNDLYLSLDYGLQAVA